MSVTDLSNIANAFTGVSPMDSVSGASSYVPSPATSAESVTREMRSEIQQNSQDFKALKTALNSNDLAGATQAFATLQQDITAASTATGGKSPFDATSPIGKDFQAIGAALKSGDLSAAKQAFTTFKVDIKAAGRAARSHHPAVSAANIGGQDTSTVSSATSSSAAASTLNTTA